MSEQNLPTSKVETHSENRHSKEKISSSHHSQNKKKLVAQLEVEKKELNEKMNQALKSAQEYN
jgi:hypothetical protein